jgi:hypothetical protein
MLSPLIPGTKPITLGRHSSKPENPSVLGVRFSSSSDASDSINLSNSSHSLGSTQSSMPSTRSDKTNGTVSSSTHSQATPYKIEDLASGTQVHRKVYGPRGAELRRDLALPENAQLRKRFGIPLSSLGGQSSAGFVYSEDPKLRALEKDMQKNNLDHREPKVVEPRTKADKKARKHGERLKKLEIKAAQQSNKQEEKEVRKKTDAQTKNAKKQKAPENVWLSLQRTLHQNLENAKSSN